MNINISDLKKEYSFFCSHKTAASRKNCLSPEKLIMLARKELSDKEKEDCLMHISNCVFCSREIKQILTILQFEKKAIKEIIKNHSKNKNYFLGIPLKTVVISVALLLIAASSIFIGDKIMNTHIFRGNNPQNLKLIKPVDTYTSKPFPVFTWTPIYEAEYYVLELYDKFLEPLWESNKLYSPELRLPEEVVLSLRSNNEYYWMVTAYLDNKKTIESSLEKFIFRRVFR